MVRRYNPHMLGAIRSAFVSQRQSRALQREIIRLRKELAQSQQYSFTADWMTNRLEDWRQDFAKFAGLPGLRMLEIGSYEGRSAVWFLENILTHPTSRLVCIDPFFDPTREIRFDHNINLCQAQGRVEKRHAGSETVLHRLEKSSFDLIYVDGAHEAPAVLFDAMLSWDLLKPGGLLVFDDYQWQPNRPPEQRPQLAIDLFLRSHAGRYNLVRQAYQVVIEKKEGE